jgi:hypothetical protein
MWSKIKTVEFSYLSSGDKVDYSDKWNAVEINGSYFIRVIRNLDV